MSLYVLHQIGLVPWGNPFIWPFIFAGILILLGIVYYIWPASLDWLFK